MDAQITERTTHVFLRHMEHSPSRNTAASNQIQICIIDFAQASALRQAGSRFEIVGKAQRLDYEQMPAGLIRRAEHFFGIRAVHRNGLFTNHMAACPEAGQGILLVVGVGSTYRNNIRLFFFQHFVGIHIILGNPMPLGSFSRRFLPDIRHGYDSHLISHGLIGGNMRRIADHAIADNRNFILFHFVLLCF